MTVGQVVLKLRQQKRVTQIAASREIGITDTYLSLIERDKARPSLLVIDRIAEYYNTDVYNIFCMMCGIPDSILGKVLFTTVYEYLSETTSSMKEKWIAHKIRVLRPKNKGRKKKKVS